MPIKPVTYYEAWCDAPAHSGEKVEMGDYSAFSDAQQTADEIGYSEGLVTADGRVYCTWECIPPTVCPDTDDNVHAFVDGECVCGAEPSVENGGLVAGGSAPPGVDSSALFGPELQEDK
jgi:hypothetical protein